MTYFPLHQTTCFFIPLVAPCKPLLSFLKSPYPFSTTADKVKRNTILIIMKKGGVQYEQWYGQQYSGYIPL